MGPSISGNDDDKEEEEEEEEETGRWQERRIHTKIIKANNIFTNNICGLMTYE